MQLCQNLDKRKAGVKVHDDVLNDGEVTDNGQRVCTQANGEATRRPKVSKNLEDAPLSMKES